MRAEKVGIAVKADAVALERVEQLHVAPETVPIHKLQRKRSGNGGPGTQDAQR